MRATIIEVCNGLTVKVANDGKEDYVVLKPTCKKLGIDYKKEADKLREQFLTAHTGLKYLWIDEGEGDRKMLCLRVRFLFYWLFTINALDVVPPEDEKLIAFQRECCRVLGEQDMFTDFLSRL